MSVVAARDAQAGVQILGRRAVERLRNRDGYGAYWDVILSPGDSPRLLQVAFSSMQLMAIDYRRLGIPEKQDHAVDLFSEWAIGRHLDTHGPIVAPTERDRIVEVDGLGLDLPDTGAPRPPDTELLAYIAAKLYWGWKHGEQTTALTLADHHRLGVPPGELGRVAMVGEGEYWEPVLLEHPEFRPLSRLLRDVPAGHFPGIQRDPLLVVGELLSPPRYGAVAHAFEKAVGFLTGSRIDLPNGTKEAVAAVESLAKIVTEQPNATLGDAIKTLRHAGQLRRPLDKIAEALWGFSSESEGVRHGAVDPPTVTREEAHLVLNTSASLILYLLEQDRGTRG